MGPRSFDVVVTFAYFVVRDVCEISAVIKLAATCCRGTAPLQHLLTGIGKFLLARRLLEIIKIPDHPQPRTFRRRITKAIVLHHGKWPAMLHNVRESVSLIPSGDLRVLRELITAAINCQWNKGFFHGSYN